jgi:hypothetical protein
MEVSCYWQRYIRHVTLCAHQQIIILSVDGHLPQYGYTHIQLCAVSCSCCFWSYGQLSNVNPGLYFWCLHWQCNGVLTSVCIDIV